MGSKASKPAQAATRKFPTRAPGSAPPPPTSFSRPAGVHRNPIEGGDRPAAPKASMNKDEAIRRDAIDPNPMTDPAFSQRLRQMGVATPNPTMSNSSTVVSSSPPSSATTSSSRYPSRPPPQQNTTLNALEARRRIQERVDVQSRDPGAGREYVDAGVLRQILVMRERGYPAPDIEKRLRLKSGVVARVGPPGVFAPL